MSPVLGKKELRVIHEIVSRANSMWQVEATRNALNSIERALKPKKFVAAAHKRVKAKKAETRSEWEQIREKVFERSLGLCEGCGVSGALYGLDCDHMFSGANRKTLQSVFTCWNLCRNCHRQKTDNRPTRRWWLERFIHHCAAHGWGDMPEPDGYARAADIARAKLDSLEIQGRTT